MNDRVFSSEPYLRSIHIALLKAGYKPLYKWKKKILGHYVRDDESGRFHAITEDSRTARIHYDLQIEDRHAVFHVPRKLKKEVGRICGYNGKPINNQTKRIPKEVVKRLKKLFK